MAFLNICQRFHFHIQQKHFIFAKENEEKNLKRMVTRHLSIKTQGKQKENIKLLESPQQTNFLLLKALNCAYRIILSGLKPQSW